MFQTKSTITPVELSSPAFLVISILLLLDKILIDLEKSLPITLKVSVMVATITDTFKVIGKDFSKSINILSNNRSIEITRNAGEDNSTGVIVDLVWNTSIE